MIGYEDCSIHQVQMRNVGSLGGDFNPTNADGDQAFVRALRARQRINAGADQRERWMIMLLRRLDNGDNLRAALEDCCDGSTAGSASTDNKYLMVC